MLHGGVYHVGELAVPHSGTSGEPIVLRAAAGEAPILDGADPSSFVWTPVGEGVYHTEIHEPDPHLVLADGERLFPCASLEDLRTLSWDGTPGCFAAGTDLYVHLEDDTDPNTVVMTVSRYTVIEECEFYDTIFDWPWDGIKAVGGLEDGGIAFYNPMTGRGTVIRRNVIHDDFDGMGSCPSDETALTNETDIYENVIYHTSDDGLSTDGQCSNVRIWANSFEDVLMGISLAPVYDGPVYATRNLIVKTGVGNNSYTGSPFKFNSGYPHSGEMFLYHNTCDAVLPGNNGLYIKAPGTWDLVTARNNIWMGTAHAIHNYNAEQPVDLDYDNVWNNGLGDLVRWDGHDYATLPDFVAATGQETHGLSVAPEFVDPSVGDYRLDESSQLIDAGILIPGVNDTFEGEAPDVGAFEFHPGSGVESGFRETALSIAARPSPTSGEVAIQMRLSKACAVDLKVYDVSGRLVRDLGSAVREAGESRAVWDGCAAPEGPPFQRTVRTLEQDTLARLM